MTKHIYINDDLYEVDEDELAKVEQDAYYTDGSSGVIYKDWVKISEWIELHGVLVKDKVNEPRPPNKTS